MKRAFTGTWPTTESLAAERDLQAEQVEREATARSRFQGPRSEVEVELSEARAMVSNFYWLIRNGMDDAELHTHETPGDGCWGCRAEQMLENARERGFAR